MADAHDSALRSPHHGCGETCKPEATSDWRSKAAFATQIGVRRSASI